MATAAVVLAGATAAATGTVPQPVRDAFERFATFDEPYAVIPDDAELVASTVTDEGTTAEYWVALATDGGRCDYVRYLDVEGDHRDGWSACTHEAEQGSGMPGLFAVTSPAGKSRSAAGHAPEGTAALVVHFADGSNDRVAVRDNGFFILEYGSDGGDRQNRITAIDAINAEGAVLDRSDYP